MKKLLIVASILLACQAARAGSPNPANPAPSRAKVSAKGTTGVAAATPIAQPRQSVFAGTQVDHNPFWPIGWVKMDSGSSDANVAIPHASDFTVTSILLNEPPLAVINGKEMAEGEIAALPVNGQSVVVQLLAVQDGRVILRWQNQDLVVPLHRDEEFSAADVDANQPTALR